MSCAFWTLDFWKAWAVADAKLEYHNSIAHPDHGLHVADTDSVKYVRIQMDDVRVWNLNESAAHEVKMQKGHRRFAISLIVLAVVLIATKIFPQLSLLTISVLLISCYCWRSSRAEQEEYAIQEVAKEIFLNMNPNSDYFVPPGLPMNPNSDYFVPPVLPLIPFQGEGQHL